MEQNEIFKFFIFKQSLNKKNKQTKPKWAYLQGIWLSPTKKRGWQNWLTEVFRCHNSQNPNSNVLKSMAFLVRKTLQQVWKQVLVSASTLTLKCLCCLVAMGTAHFQWLPGSNRRPAGQTPWPLLMWGSTSSEPTQKSWRGKARPEQRVQPYDQSWNEMQGARNYYEDN